MSKPVITRFAPSPTGFLHIGGARTALFNWLYAKRYGGHMLLRIEDTDRQRSSDEAVAAILDGLTWLGLDWEGEPISQFSRADRHREAVQEMLDNGTAYKCFCTPDELQQMREKAQAEGRPLHYDGTWRDRDPSFAPNGAPFVVRLKAPQEGSTIVQDEVQGEVTFPNKDLDDLVLLRSDGTPTYMLAVVVDDHDMGVTHIIRGDDHLTNAARQTLIYQALEWDVPVMAHISLIHGADGAKLSKRHGAIGAQAYRAMGYLPEAMRNYLVRLGWSHGDDEIISTEQLLEWFDFDGINKAASRFDFAKLENLNGYYIRNNDDDDLLGQLVSVLDEIDGGQLLADNMTDERKAQLLAIMPALKERAKTLIDLAKGSAFIFNSRPLSMDEKAAALLDEDAKAMLAKLSIALSDISDWSMEAIENAIRDFTAANDLKMGKVAQPLRAATTGTTASPGVFDVLFVLGKDEVLARLSDQT